MQNPLQFHLKLPINHSNLTESSNKNTRGRPLKSNIVKFSPQPASTVSQMLQRRIEVVNGDTRQPIISKIICNTEENNQVINRRLIATYRSKSSIKLKSSDVSKEYICEYSQCPYKTKISSNLIKHKRTHTSEKPFLCDQCTFRTNFINSLKVHRRIHTTDRPYACKYCDYKCNSSSNLKKHCRHRHLNMQEIL